MASSSRTTDPRKARPVDARMRTILFTLFAPVTVPAYFLFLGISNLLGGAFYIVIEASAARLLRRPLSLSRTQIAILALPVIALAPVAATGHLILATLRGLVRLMAWIGRWQAEPASPLVSIALGLIWTLTAAWTTLTCLDAAAGLSWIGRGFAEESRDRYVDYTLRPKSLGELPGDMQQVRTRLAGELEAHQLAISPDWRELQLFLGDDESQFSWLPRTIRRKLTGLPWFFIPKEFSSDGLDRSRLLLGPLLFVWLLLIRWPGTLAVLRHRTVISFCFFARTLGAALAVYVLATWVPRTAYESFWFEGDRPGPLFSLLSPAAWFGSDPQRWVRPEWYLFNAAVWMILLGAATFIWWLAWRVGPFLGWPRYYVAYLASRLLQRKRIAFFSVGAVTLCVAMMIIVISVMGGFVDNIRERAHGLLGDLVMDGHLQGFPYYQEFIKAIGELRDEATGEPIVAQATPLIHSYGILQFPATKMTKAARVWGIRLDEYVRVNEFGEDLFYRNRFGGTNLDEPQRQPVFGLDAQDRIVLPGEMDKHYQAYVAALPLEEREAQRKTYPRDRTGYFPGPGVIAPSSGTDFAPGYEGKPYPGVVIGRDILFRRLPSGDYERDERYPLGEPCFVTVLPVTRGGDIPVEPPPKPLFRYVDDSRTGIHEIDSMNVYLGFDRLQQLLSMGPQERADGSGMTGPRCSQIQIKLHERFAWPREVLLENRERIWETWRQLVAEVPADLLEARMLEGVGISTWEEMQRSYIAAIEKEKFLVLIMFGVISIVAIFLILCIFYMIVQEKTRDIGIIKSVGAGTEGVAAIFLVYGGAIGLVGCVLGSLLGVAFVEHINEIQDWLARIDPSWRVWSPENYSFDKIPNQWKWTEVLWISGLAILASIIGAAFPAVRAGRSWPVESLRYE